MNKRNLRPIKLGLVVGSREFFNGAPALQTRAELLRQLDRMNVASAILPVDATKNGAVQSREDARRYAAFFREQREDDRRPRHLSTELRRRDRDFGARQ